MVLKKFTPLWKPISFSLGWFIPRAQRNSCAEQTVCLWNAPDCTKCQVFGKWGWEDRGMGRRSPRTVLQFPTKRFSQTPITSNLTCELPCCQCTQYAALRDQVQTLPKQNECKFAKRHYLPFLVLFKWENKLTYFPVAHPFCSHVHLWY